MQDVFIETARLTMRPVRLGDEAFIFPEIDGELTRHWIDWEPPKDISEVRRQIETSLKTSEETINVDLVVFAKESSEFIGRCDIIPYREFPGEFEIDMWVKHRAQGKGYGTEMLDGLLAWAKENVDPPFIIYSVTERNIPSEKMIQRLGAPLHREWIAMKRGVSRRVRDYKVTLH